MIKYKIKTSRMRSNLLFYLLLALRITSTNGSDVPSGSNDSIEIVLANLYLEVGNLSQNDLNLTHAIVYETVVVRVASPMDICFTPCLVILGVSGNMLSLYVFFASKLRHQSTSLYLSALAITDSLFLGQLLPPWLSTMEISSVFHRNAYCKVFVYISYVTCSLSSWLVIAFTVERFVAVQYPLQRHSLCTVRRARYIIVCSTIGAMVVNLPVIHFAGSGNQECHIDREKRDQAAKFNWVDTTITFTIPLILIIFFNTWIAVTLYRMERDRVKLTQERLRAISLGQQKPRDSDLMYPRCQRRITNMLLIVSTTFVLFNCPAYALRVCGYAYDMDSSDLDENWLVAQNIATMMFNANFGTNFYLYCFTGQNFRRALVDTVPCFRWIARRANALINRSAANQARTGSVTTSAASTGTDATCMETSFVRTIPRRKRRRSGKYIMRWTFDNSRQRRVNAISGASNSLDMQNVSSGPRPSRPGPARPVISRPGTSRDITNEAPLPGPSRVRTSRPGSSEDIIDEQPRPRPGRLRFSRAENSRDIIDGQPCPGSIYERSTAAAATCAGEPIPSASEPRRPANEWRRSAVDARRPTFQPRRPNIEWRLSAVNLRRTTVDPRSSDINTDVDPRPPVIDPRPVIELRRNVPSQFRMVEARRVSLI